MKTPLFSEVPGHALLSGLIQIRWQSDLQSSRQLLCRSDADPGSAVGSVSCLSFALTLTWEYDPEAPGVRLGVSAEVSLIQSRNVSNDKERQQTDAISSPFSTFVFQFRCFAVCVRRVHLNNCKNSCFPFPHGSEELD